MRSQTRQRCAGPAVHAPHWRGAFMVPTLFSHAVANAFAPCALATLLLLGAACKGPGVPEEPISSKQSAIDAPTSLGRASKVSGNLHHSCVLLDTGRVACWGSGGSGQLGNGDGKDSAVPVAVSGLTDAVSISAGDAHTCALRSGGSVMCWGQEHFIGNGLLQGNANVPVPVPGLLDAVAISAGTGFVCAVRATGEVVWWGNTGSGNATFIPVPVAVAGITDAVSVAAGAEHACAIRRTGEVKCWGRGDFGQLGDGNSTSSNIPVLVSGVSDAVAVTAGQEDTCVIRAGGSVVCWGWGDVGQLGNGASISSPVPVTVSGLSDAVSIAAGVWHNCAVRGNGGVVCWGRGVSGQLGNGASANSSVPVPVSGLSDAVSVAGGYHTCAVRATGEVVCWGWGGYGALGNGHVAAFREPVDVVGLTDAVSIAAGPTHTCAARSGGGAVCWGAGPDGELGNGTWVGHPTGGGIPSLDIFPPAPVPVAVSGLTDAVTVAAGYGHACAARRTGELACWGRGSSGQLGYGVYAVSPVPVGVLGLADVVSFTGGSDDTCATLGSGEVDCWGGNFYGLGTGNPNQTSSSFPVAVLGLSDGVSVAAGYSHMCAVRRTGEVACWGYGLYGQLGNGTTADSSVPVAVSGLTDAVTVAAGYGHTCALRQTGEVACWGYGALGQLGNDSTSDSHIPVAVVGLTDAVSIAAGMLHTCAVRATGEAVCWGLANAGQLGNSGPIPEFPILHPVPVVGLVDAMAVTAGEEHTCAVRRTGQAVCWGWGGDGQLGEGGQWMSNTPVPVLALGDNVGLACGVAADCSSGFCVDGVCCASACGGGDPGDCQACSVAAGAATDGTCGPVPDSHICRASVGTCDQAESCDGISSSCPTDRFAPAGLLCRLPINPVRPCDAPEFCTGVSPLCPPDQFFPPGHACRLALGPCDVTEVCPGGSPDCPPDHFLPSTTICRSSAGVCDVAETCTGTTAACPADGFAPSTTTCRSSAGPCDLPETCSGASPTCAPDAFVLAGVVCQPPTSMCENAGICGGAGPGCSGTTSIPGCSAQAVVVCQPPGCTPPPVNLNGGSSSPTPGGITLTFTEIDASSSIGVVASGIGPTPPSGYQVIGPGGQSQYWDVTTTIPAPYSGSIRVCIHYDPHWISPGNEPFITLRHDDGIHTCGGSPLCNITIGPVNTTTHVVCGATNSLSPFAIVQPIPMPPVVTVPANMIVQATGSTGAVVTYAASANDVPDGPLVPTCTRASGSIFPIGLTTVVCSATDGGGLTSSASFTVTVRDATGPLWSGVPATINAFATATTGAKVSYTPPKATDAVDGARTVTCTPASGSQFPVNKTMVTCKAADMHGNQSTATLTVWVTYQAPTDGTFFLIPIRANGSSIFPIGPLPVPTRFRLTGASAGITNLVAKFAVTKISSSIQGTANDASDETASDTGLTFIYRPLLKWYAYRWKTSDQTQGTYQIKADLGDGVLHQVNVSLRAR